MAMSKKEIKDKNKYYFYVPIYGIIINGSYKIGEFELCDRNTFLNRIKDEDIRNKVAIGEDAKYYLSILAVSNDRREAQRIAYKKTVEFKRLMDFACGRGNSVPAVNIRQYVASSEKCLILSDMDSNVYVSEEINNNYIPIDHKIEDLVAEMENNKTSYIWDLYSKPNKSDRENRILNAILWVGKAHIETDNRIYFLELCFALESLLHIEMDKFLNPSIAYSISTSCAIIIADDFKDREKVVKTLKDVYRKRSNIAHGKNIDISNVDCETLFMYIAYLLNDLSSKEPWNKFVSMQELWLEIEKIKLGKEL